MDVNVDDFSAVGRDASVVEDTQHGNDTPNRCRSIRNCCRAVEEQMDAQC